MIQVRHMVNVDKTESSWWRSSVRVHKIFKNPNILVWGSFKITRDLSGCLLRKFLQILQNIAPRCLLEFLQTSYFALSVHFCTISGHDCERWGGI